MSLRVTPDLKRAIDDAAAKSGRSLSQEIEFRLERSFHDETLAQRLNAVIERLQASEERMALATREAREALERMIERHNALDADRA